MRCYLSLLGLSLFLLLSPAPARAQFAERPQPIGPGAVAVDVSGRSIKSKRVRSIHTTDPRRPGGTAYLVQKDPYLAYQLGRNLVFREFRERDGVFGRWISDLAGRNPDSASAKITANNHTSCSSCHNIPVGNPGGGTNFSKESGVGRNTPHFYGSGIMEMLGEQITDDLMRQLDTNRNGWIDGAEAEASAGRALVRAGRGGPLIDFGDPRLRRDLRTPPNLKPVDPSTLEFKGSPLLNNIFVVWYVDKNGVWVDDAREVDGVTTFGYKFGMLVWGFGQGFGRGGQMLTNRQFLWDPFDTHSGLQAYDPSTRNDPDKDGVSVRTLVGARQYPFAINPPDCGWTVDPLGFSRDDPDDDGHLSEITEGDLDLAEFYMLNAPRPAFAGTRKEFQAGMKLMDRAGCTDCHVNSWDIHPQGKHFSGDRRTFDFDVYWNERAGRLEGKLVPLYSKRGDLLLPKRGGFTAWGLFTDFKHHDLGDESAETDFAGTINRHWRTTPLWGLQGSFPYHHDGLSLSVEHSISRHGGEAAASRSKYLRLSPQKRRALLDFLDKLVLYDIEGIPADIDRNGRIDEEFMVAGVSTGMERFNAEWLFRVPLKIQGIIHNEQGAAVRSFAGTNVARAYGEQLQLLRDSDDDGWPDVWDHAPARPGYWDGVKGRPYELVSGPGRPRPMQDFNRKSSCDKVLRGRPPTVAPKPKARHAPVAAVRVQ